ncbi:MAG: ABC transporter permease [Peptococcaceae bacterium]|nr:ABC transporter permease [Peptococcaceae bacterium]
MNKKAYAGACFLSLVVLIAVLAPHICNYHPVDTSLGDASLPPSREHLFGTDDLGRDVFCRCVFGARVSLAVAFSVALITTAVGVAVGLVCGYTGGLVDNILMRAVDILNSLPNIIISIVILAFLKPGIFNVLAVLAFTGWTATARVVRSEAFSLKTREFVLAARALGAPDAHIIFLHLLPNVLAPALVAATFSVAHAILAEATLSFLGLGIPPHEPSWGNIMMEEMDDLMVGVWWTVFFPGVLVVSTVLAVNFLGEGLKDALETGKGDRHV